MNTGMRSLLLAGASAVLLSACGSGDSRQTGIEGTGGPAIVAGTITGFGSIYLNGIHYTTDQATILLDGVPATEDALQAGMTVQVRGSLNSARTQGSAEQVHYHTLLRGLVTDVEDDLDPHYRQLTLLGQTLRVPADSLFEGVSFEGLAPGLWLAVSGLIGADTLQATRVDALGAAPTQQVVSGSVSNWNSTEQRLHLGALTVDLSQVDWGSLNPATLSDGLWLQVQGLADETQGNYLLAEQVRALNLSVIPQQAVLLEGLITQLSGSPVDTLHVNGLQVDISHLNLPQSTRAQLAVGVQVKVTGTATGAQSVRADGLTLLLPSNGRVIGSLESVDLERNTLHLLGSDFQITRLTGFQDSSPQLNRLLNIHSLQPGDVLELFTRPGADALPEITRLKRLSPQGNNASLTGTVGQIGQGFIRVQGVRVTLEDIDAALVAQLSSGQTVQITGQHTGFNEVRAEQLIILNQPQNATPAQPVSANTTQAPAQSADNHNHKVQ